MRFLVDMPLSPALAVWLVQQGHDAVHASHLGLNRVPDSEILQLALEEGRVVETADLDYPRLLAITSRKGPGVILFRGGNYSELETRERLARVLETVPDSDFSTCLIVIEEARIRRRRLPIRPSA